VRLHESDHHVLPPASQRTALPQHGEGLAGSRRGAQVQVQRAASGWFRQVAERGADAVLLPRDLAPGGVVGVQLGITPPVHRDVQLPGGLVLGEAGAQDVGEEADGQGAVAAAAQRPVDGAHQLRPPQRRAGEYLLAVLDARAGEDPAAARQCQPVATELGEPEQHQRVNQRQQGIHLKAEAVRQVGQVGRAVVTAEQDLRKTRQPVDSGPRQRPT